MDHHRLARHSSQPHSPEQIATALSGPGTLSISWVRPCVAYVLCGSAFMRPYHVGCLARLSHVVW